MAAAGPGSSRASGWGGSDNGHRSVSWSLRQSGAMGRGVGAAPVGPETCPHPHDGYYALCAFDEGQVLSQWLLGPVCFKLGDSPSSFPCHRRGGRSLREELRFTLLSVTLELDLGSGTVQKWRHLCLCRPPLSAQRVSWDRKWTSFELELAECFAVHTGECCRPPLHTVSALPLFPAPSTIRTLWPPEALLIWGERPRV